VCVSSMQLLQRKKNFRKRSVEEEAEGEENPHVKSDDEQERRYRVSFRLFVGFYYKIISFNDSLDFYH
jgi:hypothetical protein